MMHKKNYSIRVAVYHDFEVEAYSPEEAEKEAHEVVWDDHIRDYVIDVEEVA